MPLSFVIHIGRNTNQSKAKQIKDSFHIAKLAIRRKKKLRKGQKTLIDSSSMRKLCPNFDEINGSETVLEEALSANYIVKQYITAIGRISSSDSLKSMYAMGQVKMFGSEMRQGDDRIQPIGKDEVGGSDGKVAWTQSSYQPYHANKGPPRPLRRFFQVY
ncbi:hypothetical protein SESBI_31675 [Sesbania bispinosa]|nr:hypothetical protein SESBI_31675 [Sesbania bispinosa]